MTPTSHLRVAGAATVALTTATAALADPVDGRYAYHHGMMGGGGWLYGPFMMLIFFALLVGAVVLTVRLLGADGIARRGPEDRSHAILRERFARGEISSEEFEASRNLLEGGKT